jgi:hypothetical protein
VADAGNGESGGDAVEVPVGPGVADDGVSFGKVSDDGLGEVVVGAGLVADAQATTSRLTTIVVATGSSEERIGCPPDGG